MKFKDIDLSTMSSLIDYESEINKLSGTKTIYVFAELTQITFDISGSTNEYRFYNDAGDIYENVDVSEIGTIVSPSDTIYNKLDLIDSNDDSVIGTFVITDGYTLKIEDSLGTSNNITLNKMPVKTDEIGSWQGKINVAKKRLESMLNVHLSSFRSKLYPNPVDTIENAEILSVASDLLTLSLIFKDLSNGNDGMYMDKAESYYNDFKEEFDNVKKALDLSIDNNDSIDIYGYNQSNLLRRKSHTPTSDWINYND